MPVHKHRGIVEAKPPVIILPTIVNATVTPSVLPFNGGEVMIDATLVNADSVTIDGSTVTLPARVSTTLTHTFTLAATNQWGTTSTTLLVTVQEVSPPQESGNWAYRIQNAIRSYDFSDAAQLGVDLRTHTFGYPSSGGYDYGYMDGRPTPVRVPFIANNWLTIQDFNGETVSQGNKWVTKFDSAGQKIIRANQSIFIQWKWRQDGMYTDGGVPFAQSGAKFAYIGSSNIGATNDMIQIICADHGFGGAPLDGNHGWPFLYIWMPVFGTYTLGPYRGTDQCWYQNEQSLNLENYWHFPLNQDVWFQLGVEFGDYTTGNIHGYTYPAVHVNVNFWATTGGVTTLITTYNQQVSGDAYFPFEIDAQHNEGLQAVSFDTYRNEGDPGHDYNTQYSELIISESRIPDPLEWPAWRQDLAVNALTNITSDGSTSASSHIAAGYATDYYESGSSITTQNLTAWGSGRLCPQVGNFGSMIFGANGHESGNPASTLWRFDLEQARWFAPIGIPQLHYMRAPSYTAAPADAEIWLDPDNHMQYPNIGTYSWGGYTGIEAVHQEYIANGRTYPDGQWYSGYAIRRWPVQYGFRMNTYSGGNIRYNSLVFVPSASDGSASGTLWTVGMNFAHVWGGSEGWFTDCAGRTYSWAFDLASGQWSARSVNEIPIGAAYGPNMITAHSVKYNRVYVGGGSGGGRMGYMDIATKTHVMINAENGVASLTGRPHDYGGGGTGNAIITEGHAAHLMISAGHNPTTGHFGLVVWDLDELETWPAIPATAYVPYIILNVGDSAADGASKLGLITSPGLTAVSAGYGNPVTSGAVMWSESQQRLIVWQGAYSTTDYENYYGGVSPTTTPHHTGRVGALNNPINVHIINIPDNWKTGNWTVEQRTISLAAGTSGIHCTQSGASNGRVVWSEALDCAIFAMCPPELPVQALRLW